MAALLSTRVFLGGGGSETLSIIGSSKCPLSASNFGGGGFDDCTRKLTAPDELNFCILGLSGGNGIDSSCGGGG